MGLLDNFKLGRKNEYEVNLDLQSVEVRAGVRRLRVAWTPEMATNLERYHNVDAEQELTRMLSEEMARMIGNEIVPVQPTLFFTTDGNVGIGTTNPTARLWVQGNTDHGNSYYKYMGINNFKFGR